MKTREQVEALKLDWVEDACWDLWDSDGFEEYGDELRQFQREWERKWDEGRRAKMDDFANKCGAGPNLALAQFLMRMQNRIDELERHFYAHADRED